MGLNVGIRIHNSLVFDWQENKKFFFPLKYNTTKDIVFFYSF